MEGLISWVTNVFAPQVNRLTRNAWIAAIQEAIMNILPMVFVGSFITLISLFKKIWPDMPDLSPISSFSFGLLGLFISFLVPYIVMEKKKKNQMKLIAGATGIALFLMFIAPTMEKGNLTFIAARLGAGGMFVALTVGLFVAMIMNAFSKISLFKNADNIPNFVIRWFDCMLPISLSLFCGWLCINVLKIDVFDIVVTLFSPLTLISQTYIGFILFYFIGVVFYSFGISAWVLFPITFPVWAAAIAENTAIVASGAGIPLNINTYEVIFTGWLAIGGRGCTLPLVITMALLAKSQKLKAVGRASIVPSFFNINEPIVFGAPIAFNPILMVPMWINGLLLPTIVYTVLKTGWVTIPSKVFNLWYLPSGLSVYLSTADFKGIILWAVIFVTATLVWFPFFKAYDNQEVVAECSREEKA